MGEALPPKPGERIPRRSPPAFEELDEILNVRAVKNIVDARPFSSVKRLAAVPYVGTTALVTLKGSSVAKQDQAIQR